MKWSHIMKENLVWNTNLKQWAAFDTSVSPAMVCYQWDFRGLCLFFHIVKLYFDTRMLEPAVQLFGLWDVMPLKWFSWLSCGEVYGNHSLKNSHSNLAKMTWKAQLVHHKFVEKEWWLLEAHVWLKCACMCVQYIHIWIRAQCSKRCMCIVL